MHFIKKALKKTFLMKIVRRIRLKKQAKLYAFKRLDASMSKTEKKKVALDMYKMRQKYNFSYDEYFLYGFSQLSMEERLKFVPDIDRMAYTERLNKFGDREIFDNKIKTYEIFGKYFNRKICGVRTEADFSAFVDFCKEYNKFIVKPTDAYCGKGIEIVTVDGDMRRLFDKLLADRHNGFVAEEIIVQVEEIAKFHPQSCNTVRIPTIRFDDRVEIIHPFFRVGRGEAIVDNAGAGGIIVAIDADTGITIGAADENGNVYEKHPDTGHQLVGVEIPCWSELVALAKEVAMILPNYRYTGWDFALTNNGWVMVEGNARGQFVWQFATRVGFKEEIEEILSELGL